MKNWIILILLVFFTGCNSENGLYYFTNQKAAYYFAEIESICKKDSINILGENIYGPLMFVDRESRRIYANMPDKEGMLKFKDGIYTGIYPKEWIIGNLNDDFGGEFFAIVPIPPEEDAYRIKTRAIIELFKSFQRNRGIEYEIINTRHINDRNARLWLKLEWKALRNAVTGSGEVRLQALRDALIFRGARQELYLELQRNENIPEVYEGLANFTSLLLCNNNDEEIKIRLLEQMDMVYQFQSYAYSFGTLNGALYSYFLYETGFDFSSLINQDTDLGDITRQLYNIEIPAICRDVAGSIALNYDIDGIYREEGEREADIIERTNKQVGTFIEKPVVFIELESPYFGFEPEDVHPLDTLGTLYSTIRVSDNWGKLTVDIGGCLVSNNLKFLRITAKNIKNDKTQITGDGWVILLNRNWKIERVGQDYLIKRLSL